MATVRVLNPRVPFAVAANLYDIGEPSGDTVGSFIVRISAASSLSLTFRGEGPGTAGGVTTSSPQLGYVDMAGDGTQTAGATAITGNGTFRVACDGQIGGIHVTAGTATISAEPLVG